MAIIDGKWTRSGSVPQDTAAWVDEYILKLHGKEISGTYRHYHEGPGPQFSDLVIEEKERGLVTGEYKSNEYHIRVRIVEGYETGKTTAYQIVPRAGSLDLIFTREDGSIYTETLRKG